MREHGTRAFGRITDDNVSGPGAIGVAPDLTSTYLGGADMPDRTCSVDGCERRHDARGLCVTHYTRWKKHGDPSADVPVLDRMPPGTPYIDRLMAKVDKGGLNGCWLWTASLSQGTGYGQVRDQHGRTKGAHRAVYELLVGPIPEGLELDHLCCVRSCVNPAHLEPVTRVENVRRAARQMSEVSHNGSKTHCPKGHEYTPENTYKKVRPDGGTRRTCRTCDLLAQAAYRAGRR